MCAGFRTLSRLISPQANKHSICLYFFRYSYHFPELVKIVPDNHLYCRVVSYVKNRKELTDESVEPLEEIIGDSAKAQAVLDASRSSMGMDISPIDLINIEAFARRVIKLADYRK